MTFRTRLGSALLSLACSLISTPSFAADQTHRGEPTPAKPNAASPPTNPSKPSTPATTPPSPEKQEAARVRFNRGVELYEEGDYKLALIEFERAYEIAPSYRMLFNIGRVQSQLGHYAKALRAFEQYLAEGGDHIPADRRLDVGNEIALLRGRTAALTVRVSVAGAEIELDQERLGRSPLTVQTVDAGDHRLRVTKAGFAPQERAVVLAGSDASTVDVTLVPLEAVHEVAPRSRPEVWIMWGTTGALAAAAGVCGVVALNNRAELQELKDAPGSQNADRVSAANRAQSFGTAGDVLGIGAVAAGGVALFLTLRKHSTPSSTPPSTQVGLGFGSVRLTSQF